MIKILVVDSDFGIRTLLTEALSEFLPHTLVTTADTGETALTLCRAVTPCPFHVVVTGIALPEMDGLQLTATLRALFLDLPVIIMSGSPEPAKHLATAFIRKPFRVKELAKVISRLLAGRAMIQRMLAKRK